MTFSKRIWIAIAACLSVVSAAPALAQTVAAAPISLESVAVAVDTGDLALLRAAAADQDLISILRVTDPDTLIAFQLALAKAFAEAGQADDAIRAYQAALDSILAFRGQGDISVAELMEAVARLASSPATRAEWLLLGFEVRERVWGENNPNLAPYLAEVEAARAVANLPPLGVRGVREDGVANFDLVDIYCATHRAPTGLLTPANLYGGDRGPLAFGMAEVSVPRDRAPGSIPRPSIWTFEFRSDPDKHMILNSVTPIVDRDSFFSRVSGVVAATERKEVFVFIHGYNTSFEGAAIRTAQLAVDMNLDGAPILYSWPSRASLLGYQADTRAVADPALLTEVADFLTDVAQRTGAERVHLVAHSMGNRVLERALDVIAARTNGQPAMFNEVVFAAPDIGIDEFEATFPRILPTGERFTLYASRRDRALQISQQVNRMQRVGDARDIVVRDGLQTVDTTSASKGLLGHDDFAGSALADFRAVMWLSLAPDRRCVLETEQSAGGRYWVFGGGCPEEEFVGDIETVRTDGAIDKALARLDDDASKAAALARDVLIRKLDRLAAMFGITSRLQTQPASTPASLQ